MIDSSQPPIDSLKQQSPLKQQPLKQQSWTDRVRELLSKYPALMMEVLSGIADNSPIPQNTEGDLDIWFDGKLALLISQDNQILYELSLEPAYRPDLMCIYGAGALLFVKIQGEVLFNRLPDRFHADFLT